MRLSRRAAVWRIPSFLAIHNAEEALTFRQSVPRIRDALPALLAAPWARLTYPAFVEALVALSAVAFGIAAIAASVFHGYSPGLVTAVLVNGPFVFVCMRRAYHDRWLSPTLLRATLPAAIVLHGPVLLGGLWLAGSSGR